MGLGSSPSSPVSHRKATESDCVLFPIGACDDMAHSQNEKLNRKNYINGMKCLASYLDEIASIVDAPIKAVRKKGTDVSEYSKWRKKCEKEQLEFGCDCIECFVPGEPPKK